jgi:Na+-transporting NADH:ubiquinone oxidoreductase subunit NqrC
MESNLNQMNKTLKVILIIFGSIAIVVLSLGYYGWKNMQELDSAQRQADYIMDNLDDPNVISKFPEKYFPKNQISPILQGINEKCDWKNRDGKFVDFFTQKNIGGTDQNAFIYEYYLKCDSLRFILSFSADSEPELMGFRLEPLETENAMILSPEKQLKKR